MLVKKILKIKLALALTFICFNGVTTPSENYDNLKEVFQNLESGFVPVLPRYFKKIQVKSFQRRPNGFDVTVEQFPTRIRWSKTSRSFLFNGHKFSEKDIANSRVLNKKIENLLPRRKVSSVWSWLIPEAHARRRFTLRRIFADIFRHLRLRRSSLIRNNRGVSRNYYGGYDRSAPCPLRETTSVTNDGYSAPIYQPTPGDVDIPDTSFPTPTPDPTPTSVVDGSGNCPQGYDAQACQVIELTNQHRQRNGLRPLAVSRGCTEVAHSHATDMVRNGFFDHHSPTRGGLHQRARSYGFRSAGENIARGQRSPAEAVRDWISSPGHNANLLGNYTHIGVARVQNDWVQCFSVE